ncbi:MAG: hypothetical protein E5W39_09590 [Mesorhizobium sp.]|nr:MAG: hypothetical protein E5W39_09590 [Mesorhizobium sp.]
MILDPLIAEGSLEHVLPDWHYAPHHVHAVYPSNRFIPLKVRRFVAGFADHLAAMGALIDDKSMNIQGNGAGPAKSDVFTRREMAETGESRCGAAEIGVAPQPRGE